MSKSHQRQRTDRRGTERIPLAIPTFVRGVDEYGQEFVEFTTALNISGGGALLVMRRHLPPSSEVFLEIPAAPFPPLKMHPQPVRCMRARVVRVTHLERANVLGLEFTHPVLSPVNKGEEKGKGWKYLGRPSSN